MAMYNRVLTDRLRFITPLKPTAKMLLTELLERNPKRRLGYGTNGAQAIQAHPYFFGTDWDQVKKKTLSPPYIPEAQDDEDTRHFDQEFLDMTPRLSPPLTMMGSTAGCYRDVSMTAAAKSNLLGQSLANQDLFLGFSYTEAAFAENNGGQDVSGNRDESIPDVNMSDSVDSLSVHMQDDDQALDMDL